MKKNKAMRMASALLILTLLTTCVISSTFAKYTTSANGTDSARVAKWGFEANDSSIVLDNLFKTAYDKNVNGAADVIAPGTTNSVSFKFEYDTTSNKIGAPEVAYTFQVSTEGSTIDESIENNKNIQWKLDEADWTDWDGLLTAIQALDGNKAATADNPENYYAANTLPEAFENSNDTHTVSWRWIFSTDDSADEADTEMGNADELAKVTLKITVTATQVD